jgi:hypothetical protein
VWRELPAEFWGVDWVEGIEEMPRPRVWFCSVRLEDLGRKLYFSCCRLAGCCLEKRSCQETGQGEEILQFCGFVQVI